MDILNEAKSIEKELVEMRRYLHANAETEFELTKTVAFVKSKLSEFGCEYTDCGKNGVVSVIGDSSKDKCILIRGDMDALPGQEQTDLEFACKNGNMHACGHDMHTAMLLGVAKILKKHEKELQGQVKLMFQPAEEIFSGSKNMIENGVLENPAVRGGLMLHVMAGVPLKSGTVVVSSEGVGAPAADYFTINIQGKGCHGSTPQQGIDALTIASHILLGLQEIPARELGVTDEAVVTVGLLHGGTAGNVIADTAVMQGTIRAFNDEIRNTVKKRIVEISESIGNAYRGKVCVSFSGGCPTLKNDGELSKNAEQFLKEMLGEENVLTTKELGGASHGGGSDDFAYISQQVPSLMLALAAGEPEKGFQYSQHHPKVIFDESVLPVGTASLSCIAIKYLQCE